MRSRHFVSIALVGVCFLTAGFFVGSDAGDKDAKELKKLPAVDEKKTEEKEGTPDEEMLRRAEVPTDGVGLVKFFQKRTLSESDRPAVEKLVHQLGFADYRIREQANLQLQTHGVAALEILRSHSVTTAPLELRRRIDSVIHRVREKEMAPEVIQAAVRVLMQRKSPGTVEALLGYLPFTEHEAVIDEIRWVLSKNALKDGKPLPALLTALSDRAAIRRATAAEALGRAAPGQVREPLSKLLQDRDPLVRLRAAESLVYARDRDAVLTIIDTLVDLPLNTAWQTEDFLLRLAGGTPPPAMAMGNDKDAREKCRKAWQTWWQKHGAKIDLGKMEPTPPMLGRSLVVLLDQGKVMDLGPDNMPRWEIKGLVFPLDAQILDEDRVLVAEYHADRVTERNARGELLWQVAVRSPLAAQRLANGNTFVVTDQQFFEYDKDAKEVLNVVVAEEGRRIMKAMKLPSGEIVCMMADARVVRFDAKGQETTSFPISLNLRLFGGRVHVLPSGRVIVPHNAEGKVVEYDGEGKAIWEVAFEQPVAAMRLANGNTVITSMNPAVGAVEVDRTGNEVWSFRQTTRVTRALRR